MEIRFAKKLYSYYKSFEFQSLWDVEEKIAEYQRLASSATDIAGKLQGVAELQKAIAKIDELESSAQNCYTSYRVETDIHKWSFDSSKDGTVWDYIAFYQFHNLYGSVRGLWKSHVSLYVWKIRFAWCKLSHSVRGKDVSPDKLTSTSLKIKCWGVKL